MKKLRKLKPYKERLWKLSHKDWEDNFKYKVKFMGWMSQRKVEDLNVDATDKLTNAKRNKWWRIKA
jgi:hypothetical protein